MSYRAYPKLSPTRWRETGDVPSGWEARRLKFAVTLRNEKVEADGADRDYVGLEHIESWTGRRIEDESASSEGIATRFVKDDVLFGKLRPYLAKVFLAESEGLATTEALVLVSDSVLLPAFLKYQLISEKFINAVSGTSYGAKMPRANWEAIGGLPILLPSHEEQRHIAAFLDWKTAQIDGLIARKRELLEKLTEKRNAVIAQAVTRGLNPAAPLRDSGIPWLGQVPEHWEVLKTSWVCTSIRDGTHNPPERASGIHRLLSVRNVQDGRFALLDDDRTMTPEDFEELQRSYTVQEGDIVLAIVGATTGKSAIVGALENVTVQRSLAILRPDRDAVSSAFLHYVIQSPAVQTEIALTVFKYSAQPGIYLDDVGRLPVVKPPLEEQVAIAEWLDKETAKLDALSKNVESAIARLTEYRAALITAATTGKIDVRGVVIPSVA